jgi:toxin-antitoxin system PIN domain toxin
MKAVDTNILVYAHRKDMPKHAEAFRFLKRLAEGTESWAIPWPCLHEFFSIVTNTKIFGTSASTSSQAIEQIRSWLESPSMLALEENEHYATTFLRMAEIAKVKGPLVHDLRILSICDVHDVDVLFTFDRDFSKFSSSVKLEKPF